MWDFLFYDDNHNNNKQAWLNSIKKAKNVFLEFWQQQQASMAWCCSFKRINKPKNVSKCLNKEKNNDTEKYWKYQYINIYFFILYIKISIFPIKRYIIDIWRIKRYFTIPNYWNTEHWLLPHTNKFLIFKAVLITTKMLIYPK